MIVDAERVFGDGSHATTRLALVALRDGLAARRGARVVDVGTGSGILAAAALAAGAGAVIAIDRDARAAALARARCPGAHIVCGEAALTLPSLGTFDVVVANLGEPGLAELVPILAGALRPDGLLLVTGALLWQGNRLARALAAAGLCAEAPRALAGWCLFAAARPD